MHYLMLINVDEERLAATQTPAEQEAQVKWTRSLVERGLLVSADRLRPPKTARTGRRRGGRTIFTDGPFVETKEHLGGYYLVDVPDAEAAFELGCTMPVARGCPVFVVPVARAEVFPREGERPPDQTMAMFYDETPKRPSDALIRAWAHPAEGGGRQVPLPDGRAGVVAKGFPTAVALIDGDPATVAQVVGDAVPDGGSVELRPVVLYG